MSVFVLHTRRTRPSRPARNSTSRYGLADPSRTSTSMSPAAERAVSRISDGPRCQRVRLPSRARTTSMVSVPGERCSTSVPRRRSRSRHGRPQARSARRCTHPGSSAGSTTPARHRSAPTRRQRPDDDRDRRRCDPAALRHASERARRAKVAPRTRVSARRARRLHRGRGSTAATRRPGTTDNAPTAHRHADDHAVATFASRRIQRAGRRTCPRHLWVTVNPSAKRRGPSPCFSVAAPTA